MQEKNRFHTFHLFEVNVFTFPNDAKAANELIWKTLSNPQHYQDGISKLAGRHDGTGFQVELREVQITDKYVMGCIAKCREDAPPLRKKDKSQVLQALSQGDTFLEKNYFRYDKETAVLIWQFNLSGNGYNTFGQMLTVLAGHGNAFSCDPIVEPGFSLKNNYEIEYLDFRVVMPKSKGEQRRLTVDQDPTDWGELNPFKSMKACEARQFEAKVTSKRNSTLGDKVIRLVTALSDNSKHVRKLKLKIDGREEPIDMLTQRFKSKKEVTYHGHHLVESSMFAALGDVWDEYTKQTRTN